MTAVGARRGAPTLIRDTGPPGGGDGASPSAASASAELKSHLSVVRQQQLIQSCQAMVNAVAWKIYRKLPPQIELEDLISYGQLGLALAARDFDPRCGTAFTTYAYYRIRGSVFDGLSQMSWFSRADYHASKYERMREEIERHQRLRVRGGRDLEDAAEEITDEDSEVPESAAVKHELSACLHRLIEALPPDAAALIRNAYFEGHTLHEAARRMGISAGWASRLHAQTLEKLGRSLRQAQVV